LESNPEREGATFDGNLSKKESADKVQIRKGKVMKTKDFLKKHDACPAGARWALSISEDMADVWEAMIEQGKHEWLRWTATRPGVFSDSILRKLACRFIRETPLSDGRRVWDLLKDERSRRAVEVAERYADGNAMDGELQVAYNAADDAAYVTSYAAYAATYAARADARAAVRAAARAATYAAADDAAEAANAVRASACAADATAYAAADDAYDAADDAKAAQIKMIAELGNPFGKGDERMKIDLSKWKKLEPDNDDCSKSWINVTYRHPDHNVEMSHRSGAARDYWECEIYIRGNTRKHITIEGLGCTADDAFGAAIDSLYDKISELTKMAEKLEEEFV
jgi:hypothetical protein